MSVIIDLVINNLTFISTHYRMKVQKVQEVLCSGFLDVLRLSSLRSKYLSVYEKVRLPIMENIPFLVMFVRT